MNNPCSPTGYSGSIGFLLQSSLLSTSILNQKVPRLIKAAGIDKHITFHCFRHTFAMRLLDKGVDIPTIAFLLGHKFLGSSLSYLLCTRDHLEEVIAKLEK